MKSPLLLVGMQMLPSFGKQFGDFLQTKILFPHNLAIGIYPKGTKEQIHIKTCTQMFIAALFMMAEVQKQP